MSKIQVTVDVEKATYDVGQAFGQLVVSAKSHLATGATVANIVALLSENVKTLVTAIEEVGQLGADVKESPEAFANALLLGLGKAIPAFLPAPTPAATPAAAAPSATPAAPSA